MCNPPPWGAGAGRVVKVADSTFWPACRACDSLQFRRPWWRKGRRWRGKGQWPPGLAVLGEVAQGTTWAVLGLLVGFTESRLPGRVASSWPFSSRRAPSRPPDEQGVERPAAQAQLPLRGTQQLPAPTGAPAGRQVFSLVPEAWGRSSGGLTKTSFQMVCPSFEFPSDSGCPRPPQGPQCWADIRAWWGRGWKVGRKPQGSAQLPLTTPRPHLPHCACESGWEKLRVPGMVFSDPQRAGRRDSFHVAGAWGPCAGSPRGLEQLGGSG